jgi:hypothetical protein
MTNSSDDLDTPLWGANKIADVINRSPRSTFHLLEQGYLDADKVGHQWVSTKRRLLARIAKIDGPK